VDAVVVVGLFHTAEAWRSAAMALIPSRTIQRAEIPVQVTATAAIHKRARPSLQFFLGRINERSDFHSSQTGLSTNPVFRK
jgi:hypothetical protein